MGIITGSNQSSTLVSSAGSIVEEVRRTIADITRYPIDILEPEADVEEELGIDSVKLGEILAVLRERFQLPPSEELRSRFPAKQFRTIAGIAEAVEALNGGAVEIAAPVVMSAQPPVLALAPEKPVLDAVREIFAEVTRYPLDILSADADLEEDLGIDSVKLGEIFSALRERYALPPREELADKITPAQLRTIAGVTEIVAAYGHVASEAAGSAPSQVVDAMPPAAASPPPAVSPVSQQDRTLTITWADPSIGAAAAMNMAGIDYLRALWRKEYPAPPMASLMGIEMTEIEPGRAVFEVTPSDVHYNPIGVVHGGLAATVLDSAMACAVHSTLPAGSGYATVEFKVNLVRPLRADVGRLRAVAEVVHAGGRIATAQARLCDEAGALYAHATETCFVLTNGARD